MGQPAHLDGGGDALTLPSQTRAFPPAHGLQHLVANVTVVDAVFGGLLIIPASGKHRVTLQGSRPGGAGGGAHHTYTVPASSCFLRLGSGGSGMPYFSRLSAARSRYFIYAGDRHA